MPKPIEEIKKEIPPKFHFLLRGDTFDTEELRQYAKLRELPSLKGFNFNRCERCDYDLFTKEAYEDVLDGEEPYPTNGFVKYYQRFKLVLCDRCVDYLSGCPWSVDNG